MNFKFEIRLIFVFLVKIFADRLGFLIFHLDIDFSAALKRNFERSSNEKIPVETMQRMDEEFQRPDPKLNDWERNSILIDVRENFHLRFVS